MSRNTLKDNNVDSTEHPLETQAPQPESHPREPNANETGASAAPADPRAPRRNWGRIGFWLAATSILLAGAVLRTWQMDQPPVDYPGDRHGCNYQLIKGALLGGSPFHHNVNNNFAEVWLISWLPVKTRWIAGLFGWELWTMARAWAIAFGVATIALAGWAAYAGAALQRHGTGRRRRIALLAMAALAFNPFHVALSRMILTEPVTLCFQAGAAACFLTAVWRRGGLGWMFGFAFCVAWAGLTKIPALYWVPVYAVCIAMAGGLRPRDRWLGAAGLAIALAIVLYHYQLTPFNMIAKYRARQPWHAELEAGWKFTELYNLTFQGRMVLLLTLPGIFLALAGMVRAPWFFRLAMLAFIVCFYGLTAQNTYNHAHAILPGMLLAAWGADGMIEALSRERWRVWGRWRLLPERGWRNAERLAGAALLAGMIAALYPQGPLLEDTLGIPRPDITQAKAVIDRLVPRHWPVLTNEDQAILSPLLDHFSEVGFEPKLERSDFFSVIRHESEALKLAAQGWIRWASLPGEPEGFLLTGAKPPEPGPQADPAYLEIPLPPQPPTPAGLQVRSIRVLRSLLRPESGSLQVAPGTSMTLEINWGERTTHTLAGVQLVHVATKFRVPVPVRQGGMAFEQGGVLCLPRQAGPARSVYTLEFPRGFPAGEYRMVVFPLTAGHVEPPRQGGGIVLLPLAILCKAPGAAGGEILGRDLYPMNLAQAVWVMSENWFYRDTRVEGFWLGPRADAVYALPWPGGKAGRWRLELRGSATSAIRKDSPEPDWPKVQVYHPAEPGELLGSLAVAGRKTGRFGVELNIGKDFDFLLLKIKTVGHGPLPHFPVLFQPADGGYSTVRVRGVKLVPSQK